MTADGGQLYNESESIPEFAFFLTPAPYLRLSHTVSSMRMLVRFDWLLAL